MTPLEKSLQDTDKSIIQTLQLRLEKCRAEIAALREDLSNSNRKRDKAIEERDIAKATIASQRADIDRVVGEFNTSQQHLIAARAMLSLNREKLADCEKAYYSAAQPEHYRIAIDKFRVELNACKEKNLQAVNDSLQAQGVAQSLRDVVTKLTKERDEARKELACWNTVKALTPIPPRAITWENGVEILNAVQEAMKGSIK